MSPNQYPLVICVVAVCAAVVAIVKMVLDHKDRQARREQASLDRIMDVPLEKFGDVDADRLAEKYGVKGVSEGERLRAAESRYTKDDEDDEGRSRGERQSSPFINISINHTANSNNTRNENYSGNARRYSSRRDAGGMHREEVGEKSRFVAFALCFFFGYLGVHHFYCKRIGMGIAYLVTFGLFGIGWVVDIVLIGLGVYRDRYGYRLR